MMQGESLRCLVPALAVSTVWVLDFDRLQQQLTARFGVARIALLRDWQAAPPSRG